MLMDKPLDIGRHPDELWGSADQGKAPPSPTKGRVIAMVSLRNAIFFNSGTLRKKNGKNRSTILTTGMLFGYVMVMTCVGLVLVPPTVGVFPFP